MEQKRTDRKPLFIKSTDPLIKAEQFAISLRKKKKQEIIKQKRLTLYSQSQSW
jgi:hypothetical protein